MVKNPEPFTIALSDALRQILRAKREALGWSLGELASRAGLNRQAITFIEQGERKPSTVTLSKITMALGLKPSEAWAQAEAAISDKEWNRALTESQKSKRAGAE